MPWIEETGWESWLGTGGLIGLAVVAVALLLFMVMKLKLHAFLSLVIVSLLTAIVAGIPAEHLVDTMVSSFGGTLGNVALLVAIGAMLGALVETSGGAKALADKMISIFGEDRAPFALGVAALFVGFPIFMDAAFVLMVPIIYAVGRRLGLNLLAVGIPVAAALSVMHVFLPPHPGPVAATEFTGANLGIVMILGLILAFPIWFISGHLWGKVVDKRHRIDVPDAVFAKMVGEEEEIEKPPSAGLVVFLLVLPLLLILLNTGLDALGSIGVVDPDASWVHAVQVVGATPVALLIAVLVTIVALGLRRGKSGTAIEKTIDGALGPVCSVILITGAGGMFGGVLLASGIGDALSGTLQDTGLPLVAAVFVVAAIVRVALGTATVAITTAAGLLGASVAAAGLSPLQTAALTIVLAGGSSVLSHVNDASFWLIGRLLGMSVPQTFKTWTVIKTLIGCVAAALGTVIYLIA